MEPREYKVFRCVVRHGYNDVLGDPVEFELQLIQSLKAYVQEHNYSTAEVEVSENATEQATVVGSSDKRETHHSSNKIIQNQSASASSTSIRSMGGSAANSSTEEELNFIDRALEKGVVYMLAEAEVVAHPNSSIFNKIVVNYVYSFFRKNFRQGQNFMAIPRTRLLKVGMTYEI